MKDTREAPMGDDSLLIPLLAFAAGIVVRLYVVTHTAIVNLDGIIYINQARAIVQGRWDMLFSELNFLPLNSILIIPFHWFISDWVAAGQALSALCGIGLLIPAYLTMREFACRRTSGLALIVIALSPTLVSRSSDIFKDAAAWFFLAAAVLFLVRHYRARPVVNLLASGVFFLLAACCRNEILAVYLAAATAVVLFPEKRWQRTAAFLAPAAVPAAFAVLFAAFGTLPVIRAKEIPGGGVLASYRHLRQYLAGLAAPMRHSDFYTYSFLTQASSYAWALPAIIIVSKFSEAIFPLYLPVWLLGPVSAPPEDRKDDPRRTAMALMAAAAVAVLYWQTMRSWVMEYRYTVILVLVTLPWIARGVETIGTYARKIPWRPARTHWAAALAALLIVPGLAKNIQPKMYDKAVYKTIGETCAPLPKNGLAAVSESPASRWVFFYATRESEQPRPPGNELVRLPAGTLRTPSSLAAAMRDRGSVFFLAEENEMARLGVSWRNWQGADLEKTGQWHQNDSGRLALYRLKEGQPR